MLFKYLGTAAAEAVPAPFCECEVCENARKKGGRNIRTRAQALIDGDLLIDFNPDTYMHTLEYGIKLCDIDTCLITHSHYDHLFPQELYCAAPVAAHMKNPRVFNMYGTSDVMKKIKDGTSSFVDTLIGDNRITLNSIEPFVPFKAGEYTIVALKADHGAPDSVFYIIQKGDKAILYAHDTGIFPDETWAYLEQTDIKFDLVSYDCTNVLLEYDNRGHMGLSGNVIVRDRLGQMGKLKDDCIHVVNHFSHNGLAGYDELEAPAKEKGFLVSYDGMEINTEGGFEI